MFDHHCNHVVVYGLIFGCLCNPLALFLLEEVAVDRIVHLGVLPKTIQVCLQDVGIHICILIVDVLEDVEEGVVIVFDAISLVELSDITCFHAIN